MNEERLLQDVSTDERMGFITWIDYNASTLSPVLATIQDSS